MSKYDYARRLQRIVHEDCEILKAEAILAQGGVKYNEQISFFKTWMDKQDEELGKYRKEVKKLIRENDKLEKFKQLEDRLCVLIQKLEQTQDEYLQTLERQVEQRRAALSQMDCIRNVTLANQTYINYKALPQLIQGVTINETDSSSEWKPFCIDPSKHTQNEVADFIWNDSGNVSVLKKTWEKLIFGDPVHDGSAFAEMTTRT